MRTIKRIIAILMVAAMLASVSVMFPAAETELITSEVLNSVTVEEDTGLGLAFLIRMNVKGAAVNRKNEFVNTNATAMVDGVEYNVVKMGAVMANQADNVSRIDTLTVAEADGKHILDVNARYLCEVPEAESCAFAVRITNLPGQALGCAIACRPYIVLKDAQGVETTFYGDSDISTYNVNYYASAPEETPVLNPSIAAVDERIDVTDASAEYVAYAPTTYEEAFKVTMTLENVSANAKTSDGDTITYACKDAEGNVLDTVDVTIDELLTEKVVDVEFYAPVGTATIEKADANLNYVPDIIMPAIGSDIDVDKKKNRIRVSYTEAYFNEDGSIHVVWKFKNYTSNWITEETDYITYKYYLGNTSKGGANLYIGVIDTKKNPEKTFEFDVPDYTTRVRITASKIVYWTEWA